MNPFFTEEEKKNIFRRSCWMKELPAGEQWEMDDSMFSEWLDRICKAEQDTSGEETDFLFGKVGDLGAVHISFLPFMNGMIRSVHVPQNKGMLRNGAFRDWPEAFVQALRELFVLCTDRSLSKIAGEMTLPTDVWIRERVMPVIRDGSYLRQLALDWPVAFRQMVEFTARQAAHVQELADAVCQELPEAWKGLGESGEPPAVEKVEASSSDRHRGGRSVHLLKLENGQRLVYKPHSMAIDRAFGNWLCEMSQRAGLGTFRTVSSADTTNGGFCSFIEAVPLNSLSEASEFYTRMGFLLGLVYLLRGMDLHAENIVACGKDPVIIDMETMLMPPGCLFRRWTGDAVPYSVNQMSVLPMLMALPGLRESGYACLLDMQPGTHNLPVLNGKPVPGTDCAEEIGDGFRLALQTVLQDCGGAGRELVRLFAGCRVRMVMRPTAVYCKVLSVLGNRNMQQDGKAYCRLVRRSMRYEKRLDIKECRRLEDTERKALDRLDVPYFEDLLTEKMLQDQVKEWETLPADIGEAEAERIAFCMSRVTPDHQGMQNVPNQRKQEFSSDEIRKRLRKQARRVCRLLEIQVTPLVVPRRKGAAYTAAFGVLLGEHCLLDANFGAVAALCAYLKVCPEDEEIRGKLRMVTGKLTDPAGTGAALTASELGLADGAAGFLLGCCMCREMGMLSQQEFRTILTNMNPLAEDTERVRYSEEGFLYGCYGMRYAIARVPKEECSAQLQRLDGLLHSMMRESSVYRGMQEERQLREAVHRELIKPDSRAACFAGEDAGDGSGRAAGRSTNDTLRYGNAGSLYQLTSKLMTKDAGAPDTSGLQKAGRRLAWELSGAEHVLRDVSFPQGYLETGLLHGLPGVLYSVCRFMNPMEVPGL